MNIKHVYKSNPGKGWVVLGLLTLCIITLITSCAPQKTPQKPYYNIWRVVGHWTTLEGSHRYFGPPKGIANFGYYYEEVDGKTITGEYHISSMKPDGTIIYVVGSAKDIEYTFATFECTLSDNDMKMTGCGGEFSYVGDK